MPAIPTLLQALPSATSFSSFSRASSPQQTWRQIAALVLSRLGSCDCVLWPDLGAKDWVGEGDERVEENLIRIAGKEEKMNGVFGVAVVDGDKGV